MPAKKVPKKKSVLKVVHTPKARSVPKATVAPKVLTTPKAAIASKAKRSVTASRIQKPKEVQVVASVMCIDWLNAKQDLDTLARLQVDALHWDIIDGRFVPDFTMGSSIINTIKAGSRIRSSDFHLMVDEPSRLFQSFDLRKGDTITVHQECSTNLHRDLVTLRKMGMKAGVALCPGTPLETLDYILEDIDLVLLMTVDPGYKGQKLVPQTLRKIEKLRRRINDSKLNVKIQVDGNVNSVFIPEMVAAGADILVGGSSGLFRRDIGIEAAMLEMFEAIEKGLQKRRT